MTINDPEFYEWVDKLERSLQDKSRVSSSWSSELYDFNGEYDLLCENCGRNLPCRHCQED